MSHLKIVCLNARNVVNKIPELQNLVTTENLGIVCITETWLCNKVDSAVLGLSDFNVYRMDRSNGNDPHGGVLLCVKPYLSPTLELNSTNHEVLLVKICTNNCSIKLVAAYRTPNMNPSENEDFVCFLSRSLSDVNEFILLGDFNYPGINWLDFTSTSHDENLFLNFVNENHLYQKVTTPTRGENLLDLCLCTTEDMISDLEVCETFSTSDHCYFTCKVSLMKYFSLDKVVRNYANADWKLIRSYLACIDWTEIFCNCSCENMWLKFKSIIHDVVNLFVPLVNLSQRREVPWINSFILRIIRTKKRKWRKFKNNATRRNKVEYNRYSKYVKRQTDKAKCNSEKYKFFHKNQASKQFYAYINKAT